MPLGGRDADIEKLQAGNGELLMKLNRRMIEMLAPSLSKNMIDAICGLLDENNVLEDKLKAADRALEYMVMWYETEAPLSHLHTKCLEALNKIREREEKK